MNDPASKSAMILTDADYKTIQTEFDSPPNLLYERVKLPPYGVCTHQNNFAFHFIDKIMIRLIEAGLPQYMYDTLLNHDMKVLHAEEKGPSVFGLGDLEFGFMVWLGACSVSLGVFACEILWILLLMLGAKIRKFAIDCIFLYVFLKMMKERRF